MKKIAGKKIVAIMLTFCMICMAVFNHVARADVVNAESDNTEEYKTVTFSDCGIKDGTYSPNEGLFASGMASDVTSMDGVVMKGKVTFPANGGWNAPAVFVGTTAKDVADGLHVFYAGGSIQVQDTTNNNVTLGVITNERASKNLYDVPIEIAVVFDYINDRDVCVSFGIDGVTYFKETIFNGVGKFGAGFFVNGQSNTITISSVKEKSEVDTKEFEPVTFSDCGIKDGTYSPSEGLFASGMASHVTSVDHVEMKGKVTFPASGGWNAPAVFVGTTAKDVADGLHVFYAGDSIQVQDTTNNNVTLGIISDERAGKSLYDVALELVVAFDYINDKDVCVSFSIDGVTYFKETIFNGVGKFGAGFFVNGQDNTITVTSIEEEPEYLVVTGDEYSFMNFGYLTPGKYENLSMDNSFNGDIEKLLNGGVILQEMKVVNGSDGGFVVLFTEPENPWSGIQFRVHDSGTLTVSIDESLRKNEAMVGDAAFEIAPATFGMTTFLDTDFELGIAFQTGGDNGEDLLMKIYINGVLYKNKADSDVKKGVVTIPNAAAVIKEGRTELSMITMFDGYVTLYGEAEEVKKPKLTTITTKDIGLNKAVYAYANNGLSWCAQYKGTLLNTTYTENVTFSEHANTWFHYAGPEAGDATGWEGIRFMTLGDGTIQVLHTGSGTAYLMTPQQAGVEKLLGQELELTLELFEDQYHPENALLGVYINGNLYDNRYFIFKDASASLGKYVSVYVGDENGSMRIGAKGPTPIIDDSFTKISFKSFGIHGGNYGYTDLYLAAEGNCGLSSLDRVVFSDKINFANVNGAQLRFGGAGSAWTGLLFVSDGAGNIHLMDAEGAWGPIIFDSRTAGVPLAGQDIELTLSIEYVDYDGDGKKDDVKLGVWFDGKPYGDSWIYLTDYVAVLGGNCGIYCAAENAMLSVAGGPEPVNFYEYGFTEKWEDELRVRALFK